MGNMNPNLVFCRVDVDTHKEIGSTFMPEKIPLVVFFNKGKEHTRTSDIK
jgi:thioredoxin-like negative regulator of GroEL